MIASDTQQVNLRLPAGMVKEIDRSVRKGLFRSRQEFIMAAIREELGKNEPQVAKLGGSTA
jgi:Arc/MetJ-type ribon-helix-helix transcriptional regulator